MKYQVDDTRKDNMREKRDSRARSGSAFIPPTITLAFWQLRLTWRLLLIEGVGVMAAVTLVCAIPFYSQATMAIGFRGALNNFLTRSTLLMQGSTPQVSSLVIDQSTQQIQQAVQHDIGTYSAGTLQFSLHTSLFPLLTHSDDTRSSITQKNLELQLQGYDSSAGMKQITLVRGRFPQPDSTALEILLTPQSASQLHVQVGSTLVATTQFVNGLAMVVATYHIPVQVVGLVDAPAVNLFIQPVKVTSGVYSGFTTNEQLLTTFGNICNLAQAKYNGAMLVDPFNLLWAYHVDTAHIVADQTDGFLAGLTALTTDVANQANHAPQVQDVQVQGQVNALAQYVNQSQVVQLPITVLTLQVLALLIFFVAVMAELLVEYQANAIALLHSRGASEEQVFGALVTQSILIGCCALLIGPVLAVEMVRFVMLHTFSSSEQSVVNLSLAQVWQIAFSLRWFAFPTAGAAVLSMIIAIRRATYTDMLTLRREQGRIVQKPLWQRLYLDVFAACIVFIGYIISTYATRTGLLNQQASILIGAPLAQIAPVFLVIAVLLAFLRIFPLILRAGAWLALKGRGAASMLALAQLARSPGQIMRLTLLLTLATAFIIFSQVLSASQEERVSDVASFQAGADFRGTINTPVQLQQGKRETLIDYASRLVAAQETPYRHLAGVKAVSASYTSQLSTPTDGSNVALYAVDASTFAQTAIWTAQNGEQPLSSLLAMLVARRQDAYFHNLQPAIVDAAAWNKLDLSPGEIFGLNTSAGMVAFEAVAQVQNIPTLFDDSSNAATSDPSALSGAILVDYQSFVVNYAQQFAFADQLNTATSHLSPLDTIWLKTTDNPAQLAHIRATLSTGKLQLNPLYDRRTIIAQLQQQSTQRDIVGIIALGATVPLLLAVAGNLIASWLNARNRRAMFALLRALGSVQRQLATMLALELGFIYVTALCLGCALGLVLAFVTVPLLVFTNIVSIGTNGDTDLFLAQNIPAVRIIIPSSLAMVLGVLAVLCLCVLLWMIYLVSRPSISQTLRLNED